MKKSISVIGVKEVMAFFMAVILSVVTIGSFMSVQRVEAKEWSKSQINKEIKEVDAKIKTVKPQYVKAKKEYKKAKKGTISILAGSVISAEPLIVYYGGLLGMGKGYYWIESGTEYFSEFIGTGVIKTTGGYRDYNGQTCALAKGVKIDTKKMEKLEARLEKLRSKKAKLKHALVNEASLNPETVYEEYGDGNDFLIAGESYNLYDVTDWTYADEAYSDTYYASSDKSVATVSKGGTLTANEPGTVTITIISSISKKKTEVELVIKDASEIQTAVGPSNGYESYQENAEY